MKIIQKSRSFFLTQSKEETIKPLCHKIYISVMGHDTSKLALDQDLKFKMESLNVQESVHKC